MRGAAIRLLIIGSFIAGCVILAWISYYISYYTHPHDPFVPARMVGFAPLSIAFEILTTILIVVGIAKQIRSRWLPLFYFGVFIYWIAYFLMMSIGPYLMVIALIIILPALALLLFSPERTVGER